MDAQDIVSGIENKDWIYQNYDRLTPEMVESRFEQYRSEFFDQPLTAYPVVPESAKQLRPEYLSDTQLEALDRAPYDFENAIDEPRFANEFDFYAALLRAVQQNTDRLFRLRRQITQEYYAVHGKYNDVFGWCMRKYGKQGMGSNAEDRKSWFLKEYPALARIDFLYEGFIDEIEIETDRCQQFGSSASRALSATESSYRSRGLLFDRKIVAH